MTSNEPVPTKGLPYSPDISTASNATPMPSPGKEETSRPWGNQQWIDLHGKWAQTEDGRLQVFAERIETAYAGLVADMALWTQTFPKDDAANGAVAFHLGQFSKFVEVAYSILDPGHQRQTLDVEMVEFRGLVVGVLTAQWMLLRNVIAQRVAGSPYVVNTAALLTAEFGGAVESNIGGGASSGLYALDADALQYYSRLYAVLFERLKNKDTLNNRNRARPLLNFAPLVHLGDQTQLTVFNGRTPLVISVPFGALPGMKESSMARMAIAHEVAHAVFVQVPELLEETQKSVRQQLAAENLSRQRQVLYEMAINWTEEICADLFGTALGGENFVRSAYWIMAGSDSALGMTDATHPPTVLRPVIHLLALSRISSKDDKQFDTIRKELEAKIESGKADAGLLARQFKSMPALMFVKLETVREVLTDLVQRLLDTQLPILNNLSLGALLAEIYLAPPAKLTDGTWDNWGDIPEAEQEDFVIDFPLSPSAPVLSTPGVSSHPYICCWLTPLKNVCCG